MAEPPLTLRPARQDDAELLLRWRNDASVRRQSFDTGEIELAAHARWLRNKLRGDESRIYVAEIDGRPVGQARVDRHDRATGEISVSVDVDVRGRGIGPVLIACATDRASQELSLSVVKATVKEGNEQSLRAFRSAGYTEESPGRRGGEEVVVLTWRRRPQSPTPLP